MIEKNWRAIVLVLLAVNLLFMALLEFQRRTIWQAERDYFTRIERTIISTDKTQAAYNFIQKQLSDVSVRVNNVEIKLFQDISAQLGDISARANNVEIMASRDIQPKLASIDQRVNNVEIKTQGVPESVTATREILARVNALQVAVGQIAAAKQ